MRGLVGDGKATIRRLIWAADEQSLMTKKRGPGDDSPSRNTLLKSIDWRDRNSTLLLCDTTNRHLLSRCIRV